MELGATCCLLLSSDGLLLPHRSTAVRCLMKVRAHRCCHPELQSLWLGLDNEICHQPFTLLAGQGHGAITAPGTWCLQSRASTECSWLLLLPCRARCLQVLLLLPFWCLLSHSLHCGAAALCPSCLSIWGLASATHVGPWQLGRCDVQLPLCPPSATSWVPELPTQSSTPCPCPHPDLSGCPERL